MYSFVLFPIFFAVEKKEERHMTVRQKVARMHRTITNVEDDKQSLHLQLINDRTLFIY